VTVSITYNDGHKEQFALQLKHRETGRDILEARSELNREKKNFYIASYCAEFEKLPPDIQDNYKFILFTNATFQNFHAVTNYKTQSCRTPSKSNFFNTDKIYQFQEYTNCHAAFYRKFYLFSAQKNVEKLNEAIVQIFREYFHSDSDIATCYIDFFGNLRMGNYINTEITKDEVILKLTSLLLSNHVIRTPLREERDEKIQQIEEAIQQFDVTLLQDIDKDFVRHNWCYPNRKRNLVEDWARENKMLRSKGEGVLNEQQKELLYYFKENLLFVTITQNCAELIYQIINLCKSAENVKIKFVLIGERIDNKNLEKWKIFGNLSDLKSNQELYKKMTTSFKISLQGRKAETLETLRSRFNLNFDDFITPNELFRMLQDDLLVGQAIEKLSGYYIPRILLKEEFSYKCLPEVCAQKTVIVQCNGKSKTFKELLKSEFRNLKFLDFNKFQQNHRDYTKSFVILTDEQFNQQLNSIFHLKLTDNNKLAWVDNKIKAEDLLILDKQVSVVCGTPGIGKSTMMKSLANECPLTHWVIIVPLKQHSWFFKNPSSTAKVLEYLFGSNTKIDQAILQYFKNSRHILFLFDGLDELDSNSISNAINIMKQFKDEGYKIWIFCTKYLEKTLRRELQIYSIYKIEDLKREDLKKYVCQHLQEKGVSAEKVATIIHKMFENNNEEIEKDILKYPLFLFIASEIVSESENCDNWEDILTVPHMFSRFIERRFRRNLEKVGYNQQAGLEVIIKGFKNYYSREYKFAALKTCFDPNLLENMKLKNDKQFVKQINEHGDFLGLILKINRDDTFVFCHHRFAEYFAALWLSENFEEFPLNVRRFIFDEKYLCIRYFFNLILAEGCLLHQAVLRQDVSEVERLIPTHWNKTDRGGRTPLHLAFSFGQKYPILKDGELSNNQCENSTTHQKILQCIVQAEGIDPLQKDAILGWNCFEYADASLSLPSLEELSKYKTLELDYLRNYKELKSLCHYCVSLGFVNLLTNVIHLKGLSNLDNFDKPLINLASECGQKEVVKLLIKNEVDLSRTCTDGRTALHEAALWGHCDLVKILINAKLDLNEKDSKENTPLQLAVKMGHFNIVKTLVEGGADVNTTDEGGRTPLHKASYRADTDIVEYLVEHGADVDCQDINQECSLQHAVQMGHFDVVKCLVERGANIQAMDKSKRTALHWAAYEGYNVMVKYLVGNGINIVAIDDDGKTALQIAVERQHENIVNYLKDAERGILR
jgi:ankyrin repeat protein